MICLLLNQLVIVALIMYRRMMMMIKVGRCSGLYMLTEKETMRSSI